MELMKFLNSHPQDWRSLLAADPYRLEIRQDGDYFILKYNMLMSNFNLKVVREARGAIVRFEPETNQWICVCHPFDKFFNYGEHYSAVHDIDWETATVQQKVDGSLIKFWYDRGEWHISTNGTIDAEKAECGDYNFKSVVMKAIEKINGFWDALNPTRCYMFELTSPYNHIVIRYKEFGLWYLGCRDMTTDEELNEEFAAEGILVPEVYPHHSLSGCVEAAHEMGDDEEGYVVCDANFNRIKIKGDEYLRLHKIRGNGPLTVVRVVEMYQQGTLDDFIAYYPEFEDFVEEVTSRIRYWIAVCDTAFQVIRSVVGEDAPRSDFAYYATSYHQLVRAFLFARLDNKVEDATDYCKHMRARTLASYIMAEMETTKIGTGEDE